MAKQYKNKKILIVEINSENQDILFLMKNKNNINKKTETIERNKFEKINNLYNQYSDRIENNNCEKEKQNEIKINFINKYIDLISENNKMVNEVDIIKKIKKEKENYDIILVDIENEVKNYFFTLIEEIDKIIFLTEANVLQIKKSKIYLEKIVRNYKIEKEKINIVCNKVKEETLCVNILKNVLKEYNILGKINDVRNSNLLINHNMKNIFLEREIKNQYRKIGNEILKNRNTKKYYINKIE